MLKIQSSAIYQPQQRNKTPMITFKSNTLENTGKLVTKKKIQHYTYALEEVIGKGFSSHVYKGRDERSAQKVAVKVIDMDMAKNDMYKDLLASEIYCLKLLRNIPNIIQLKDVYTTRNNTYVICELCQGGTLSSLLSRRKLTQDQALKYFQQLMRGYLHLSKLGIVHRDIKPANIFIQKDQLKIADFGFATFLSERRIQEKYNIGSPLYMPPESLMRNQYSFQSDIWSLGIVFYQMLFGRAPWRANTESQLLNKIFETPINHLIPQGALSHISTQLLIRMLDPDFKTRITPEQLNSFTFSRTSNSMNNSFPYSKTRNVSSIKQEEYLVSTNGSTSTNPDLSGLTKQLLSQMHLCRFVFKLIKKILDSGLSLRQFKGFVGSLKNYLGLKLNQISQLQNSNPFNIQKIQEYRRTQDFTKLMALARNYRSKYQKELGYLQDNPSTGTSNVVLGFLSQVIRNLSCSFSKVCHQNIRSYEPSILLLDYLTTSYMLIKLSNKNDLYLFYSKSKIEEIVDGATTSVSFDHFLALQNKISVLGLIN